MKGFMKVMQMSTTLRLWVLGGFGAVIAGAVYLWAVRGTAILLDLAAAVSAFCF